MKLTSKYITVRTSGVIKEFANYRNLERVLKSLFGTDIIGVYVSSFSRNYVFIGVLGRENELVGPLCDWLEEHNVKVRMVRESSITNHKLIYVDL